MNSQKNTKSLLKLFITVIVSFLLLGLSFKTNSDTSLQAVQEVSNTANSEKRVLNEDPVRDKKLLERTNYDQLTREIILEHSIIAGSKIQLESRNDVYLWLVDNIRISAALSRIFGNKYTLSAGKEYDYLGEDGDGLKLKFNRTYRDSASAVFTGHGEMKMFLFSVSGSFINFMEFSNVDEKNMIAQSCIYVKVNNPVTRFIANVVFAVSDIEKGIMEKMFSLDDTVCVIVKILMEDPNLYIMLQNPDDTPQEGASEVAVKIRKTILKESSPKKARELGRLIENARSSGI